eukprot:TRINITY_DN34917_c0_g1_i1.p1 TRINITY_DN34917_c0_g1~~TRINITY_DN34917_c0_g1_i1.p1  ORF type:complete len:793 (+),score=170.77 TRINITY_DN34917_c0_g1_i1:92-2470(+)
MDAASAAAQVRQLIDCLNLNDSRCEDICCDLVGPLKEVVYCEMAAITNRLHALQTSEDADKATDYCRHLGFILKAEVARSVCQQRCINSAAPLNRLLAELIQRHPDHRGIQSSAQWALSQVAGIACTLEVVRPILHNPVVGRAFMWTAYDTPEEFNWTDEQAILQSTLERLSAPDAEPDAEMEMRCCNFLGARLGADVLRGINDEQRRARGLPTVRDLWVFAEPSVRVLAHVTLRWLSGDQWDTRGSKAGGFNLRRLCMGLVGSEGCNPHAQETIKVLDAEEDIIMRCLEATGGDRNLDGMVEALLQLLLRVRGLPHVAELLTSPASAADRSDAPAKRLHSTSIHQHLPESLRYEALRQMSHMQDIMAIDALKTLPFMTVVVRNCDNMGVADMAVKVLSRLFESIQSSATVEARSQGFTEVQETVGELFNLILRFQKERRGRWPSGSATSLRYAALLDKRSRQALTTSGQLQAAVKERILSSCKRGDQHTYVEVYSTCELMLTLWGAESIMLILDEALKGAPEALSEDAQKIVAQAVCRCLAEDDVELSPKEAVLVVRYVTMAKEMLHDKDASADLSVAGPMTEALGVALAVISGDAGVSCSGFPELHEAGQNAARLMMFFLEALTEHHRLERRIGCIGEVLWGVCKAASSAPTAMAAMAAAGCMTLIEDVTRRLLASNAKQEASSESLEIDTVSAALEIYGYCSPHMSPAIPPLVPARDAMRQYPENSWVQLGALRAMNNLVGNVRHYGPQSQEERNDLVAVISKAQSDFVGEENEGIRAGAQRLLGFLAS